MITSLSTGTSGIKANLTALSVIGNNIANVNTVGFKGARTVFSDILSQSLTGGGSSQIGLGSQLSAVTPQFVQGAFETTGNGLDLALQGDGFFVVEDTTGANYYTRAGQFSINKDSYLVNPDGYKLQGYGVDSSGNIISTAGDIQISSAAIPANPTSEIKLVANLQSDADIKGFLFTSANDDIIFDVGGPNITASLTDAAFGGTLQAGTAYTGAQVATAIKTALEAQNGIGDTYTVSYNNSTGIFTITKGTTANALNLLWSNGGTTAETMLGFAAVDDNIALGGGTATSDTEGGAFSVSNPSATSNYSTSITVYDSLGNSHLVNIYFRKSDNDSAGNTWQWYSVVGSSDSQSGSTEIQAQGTLTFGTSGQLLSVSPVTYPTGGFDFTGGAAQNQTISFNFGTGTNGITQFGSPFAVYDQTQDGYTAGSLQSLSIDEDGMINGLYTNGKTRTIAQIVVADFANIQGLKSIGSNLYAESADSGQAVIGAPNSSGRASIQSGALELSNVDLANEFIKMIAAQRGFQANARTITTSDEMLQELVNLKR